MTKTDIIELLVRRSGLKRKDVVYIVDGFIERIIDSAIKGDKVEIRGFGTFYLALKKPRLVFSPIAGKKIQVPAKKNLAFKASKSNEQKIQHEGA